MRQPRRGRRPGEEGGGRRRQRAATRRRTTASCTATASRTSTATSGSWCGWTRAAVAAAGLTLTRCTRPPTRRSRPSGASSRRASSPRVARMVRDIGRGRGTGAGRAGGGAGALAARGRARQARRLADDHRQAPRARPPAPARKMHGRQAARSSALDLEAQEALVVPDFVDALDAARQDDIGDDLLRLIFTACHPVLSTDARVALTLKLLGGLTHRTRSRAPSWCPSHDRAAHRARQAHADGEPRCRSRCRAATSWRERLALGAGGGLPGLQRGLHRHRAASDWMRPGAGAGSAAPGAHAGRDWRRRSPRCTAWPR